MLRSILAIVLGYVGMAIATMACVLGLGLAFGMSLQDMRAAATQPASAPPQSAAFSIANLLSGVVCAMLGGFIAGRIGRSNPMRHAVILAALVLVFGVMHAFAYWGRSSQQSWYLSLLPIAGVIGTLIGGRLAGGRARPVGA